MSIVKHKSIDELKIDIIKDSLYHLVDIYVSNLRPTNIEDQDLEKLDSYIDHSVCILSFITGAINKKIKDFGLLDKLKRGNIKLSYSDEFYIEITEVEGKPHLSISDKARVTLKYIETTFKVLSIPTKRERHKLYRYLTGFPGSQYDGESLKMSIEKIDRLKRSGTISYVINEEGSLKEDCKPFMSAKPYIILGELKKNKENRNRIESEYFTTNKRIKLKQRHLKWQLQNNRTEDERKNIMNIRKSMEDFLNGTMEIGKKIRFVSKLDITDKEDYKNGRLKYYGNMLTLLYIISIYNNSCQSVYLIDIGKMLKQEDKQKLVDILEQISNTTNLKINYNLV